MHDKKLNLKKTVDKIIKYAHGPQIGKPFRKRE